MPVHIIPKIRSWCWILLAPLSFLWATVHFVRRRYYPKRFQRHSKAKIICVGNLHSGGSGKTPMVLEIAERYREQGTGIVSRGYGGKLSSQGALIDLVSPNGSYLYGDEPWMLAHLTQLPVAIGKNRVTAVNEMVKASSCSIVILDDGFQHLCLFRDLDILVISTSKGVQDSFCIPFGELREPLSAIRKAHAVVLTFGKRYQNRESWREFLSQFAPNIPVFEARRHACGYWRGTTPIERLEGRAGFFCGIGDPEGLQKEIRELPDLEWLKGYPDHHVYSEEDIQWLVSQCRKMGLKGLVTTDKDWFKLSSRFEKLREPFFSIRIRYDISEDFWYFVNQRLALKV